MSDVPLPETFLVLSRLQSGTEEVCRLDEAVAYAAAVSAAENARLQEQLALAETVRASQVAGLTEGAEKLREEVARLTKIIDDAWGEA